MRMLPVLAVIWASGVAAEEIAPLGGLDLRPDAGREIGLVLESWLSPQQEGGEERDTPALVPGVFKSTAASMDREDRPSRGHGTLAFTRDFARAYAHVAIEGVDPTEIVMFHIHCGKPGQLGPIIVDFGIEDDVTALFADGVLSVEITNADLEAVHDHGHGLVGAFTAGCPIVPAIPTDKVVTIAGMAQIGLEGELYYNLHTRGQTFFGDIRGQLHRVGTLD